MKEKYYDSTSSLVMGFLLMVLGFVLIIGKNQVYRTMVHMVILLMFIRAFLDLVRFFFRNKKKHYFSSCMFHLGVCLVFLLIPNLFYGVVPVLFSIYLCLIGISLFIMCLVEIKNKDSVKISGFIGGLICFGIAVPILINPVIKLDTFVKCLSCYMLLLGMYYIFDFFKQVLSIRVKNRLKRRIRITLPKIVEAVIPYSVMLEINRNLEVKKVLEYCSSKDNRESDLNILIHTSNKGFNRMGHIDIYFDGKVISYGNYDEGSRKFRDLFGDGVMFMTDKKADYINFCIDNSKKTLFDFGIVLSEKQKKRVRDRIDELCWNTIEWDHHDDKKYCDGNSYAAKLYKKTKAKFYKFKKGKYRTYFILGTNCCYLADDIVGKIGMDILSINGIITPGTYYDYLNRELMVKHSNVVSKDVYNFHHRAMK